MAFKVKHGIGTAVSMTLVLARDDTNPSNYVTEEKVFLPGATIPDNVAPWVIDQWNEGNEHLRSLLEVDGGGVPKKYGEDVPEGNVSDEVTQTAESTGPAYEDWKKTDLVAEAKARGLNVTRTDGQTGEPLVEDYVESLRRHDEALQTAGQPNPFAS